MAEIGLNTDSYEPDQLIAGDYPVITEEVTVVTGQNLVRGTVLGKITASGKVQIVDDSLATGAQTAYAILAEDVDATSADKVGIAYLSGEFNEAKLTFGGDDVADDHRAALRDKNIYLKSALPSDQS